MKRFRGILLTVFIIEGVSIVLMLPFLLLGMLPVLFFRYAYCFPSLYCVLFYSMSLNEVNSVLWGSVQAYFFLLSSVFIAFFMVKNFRKTMHL